jgi:hypothetical protein
MHGNSADGIETLHLERRPWSMGRWMETLKMERNPCNNQGNHDKWNMEENSSD